MGHYAYECKSSDFKCFHCGEPHAAVNFKCPREINERRTLDIQFNGKVSMRRAFQIRDYHESVTDCSSRTVSYITQNLRS